ncbi:MAG: cytochrome c oxidase subunit 2 [Phycisphaerae bacterium]|nr:cytochrome c oxidase subunit 2 [Phycisphaerae bacterium]
MNYWLAQTQGDFWLPPQASTVSAEVDWLFYFIYWLSVFFFVLIVGVMMYFIFRYRRQPGRRAEHTSHHNTLLELTWSGIPLLLVGFIFYTGFKSFMHMTVAPADAAEIKVEGQKWSWSFTYPNGYVDKDLHVPVDASIRLLLSSSDVIHSFYVPAFRVKKDAVPGRYNKAWFRATQPGEYLIFCAEYCGTQHSDMISKCVVHPPGEYEKWLQDASDFLSKMPPAEAGEKLYTTRGCRQCHSVDGTAGQGPSFKGIFDHPVALADGSQVVVDENYIRESILEPNKKVVGGYQAIMPTYKGRLKDEEIGAIIEYIKSLK